ncbi:hypothetical protein AB0M95_11490 [Sphaerisporangium sp. NPDC051017]|uniref:hypothetical protein n=1 Tax=Sphaerisporangium sp. NPDC051017 TaxID=3154636 RepID=UPI00343A51FE
MRGPGRRGDRARPLLLAQRRTHAVIAPARSGEAAALPAATGTETAAVQAGVGGSLQDVLDAAEDARIYRKR